MGERLECRLNRMLVGTRRRKLLSMRCTYPIGQRVKRIACKNKFMLKGILENTLGEVIAHDNDNEQYVRIKWDNDKLTWIKPMHHEIAVKRVFPPDVGDFVAFKN